MQAQSNKVTVSSELVCKHPRGRNSGVESKSIVRCDTEIQKSKCRPSVALDLKGQSFYRQQVQETNIQSSSKQKSSFQKEIIGSKSY